MTQVLIYFLVAVVITVISIVSKEDIMQDGEWRESAQVQAPAIPSIMTLGKLCNLSVLQFLYHKKMVFTPLTSEA